MRRGDRGVGAWGAREQRPGPPGGELPSTGPRGRGCGLRCGLGDSTRCPPANLCPPRAWLRQRKRCKEKRMERTEHTDQAWVEGRDSTFYLRFTERVSTFARGGGA